LRIWPLSYSRRRERMARAADAICNPSWKQTSMGLRRLR
jgi:hypothetical protein